MSKYYRCSNCSELTKIKELWYNEYDSYLYCKCGEKTRIIQDKL